MERNTKTEKKSKKTGTLPNSFYTLFDNGSTGAGRTDSEASPVLRAVQIMPFALYLRE